MKFPIIVLESDGEQSNHFSIHQVAGSNFLPNSLFCPVLSHTLRVPLVPDIDSLCQENTDYILWIVFNPKYLVQSIQDFKIYLCRIGEGLSSIDLVIKTEPRHFIQKIIWVKNIACREIRTHST